VVPFDGPAGWLRDASDYAQMPDTTVFVRYFPVGRMLSPPRKYVADFYAPALELAVEADGGAHAAGKRKMERDRERRGLLTAAGIRVLPVDPKDIQGALDLIRSALEVKNA
jgi:very-short-patch-repair endonuclease